MLSKTPPMGFNTWNTFAENISEDVIIETADKMVETGLLKAGYEYLVIDDCWSEKERDPKTGKIVPDKEKFPHGMKYVSDYVHSKGLKFGMYSCAGTRTCADYPGSFDHEYLDAKTFAEYGADFLKYDFCYKPETAHGPTLYRKMGMALRNCGREILFSACNWGSDDVNKWIRSAGAHMYRSTGDINDSFVSFKDIAMSQLDNFAYSGVGCFNDIDMLTVGMYGEGHVGSKGCNDTDYKTQFSLWCMFASPLMLGSDIRKMNDCILNLVTNKELLRINQDEEARPAFVVGNKNDPRTFSSPTIFRLLSNNEFAIFFGNFTEGTSSTDINFHDVGISADCGFDVELKNVFTGETKRVREYYNETNIPAHGCEVYIGRLVER